MAGITYFVALPFDVADDSIIVGEPIECPTPKITRPVMLHPTPVSIDAWGVIEKLVLLRAIPCRRRAITLTQPHKARFAGE
jgi:hypothetical protein